MHVIARMNVGGPAVEITELMRGLDPSVIHQTLVTGFCGEDEADYIETQAPDVSAIRIQGFGRRVNMKGDINAFVELISLMREQQPDIVHTHTAKAGVLGRLAARLSGVRPKVIHTYHGHLLHGYFGPIKTRIVLQIERMMARQTDTLIAVGHRIQDQLLAAGIGRADQYRVIYSGVRLGKIPDKGTSRKELGLPEDKSIVTMIGRLTKIKRPDRFADMVEIVRDECPDVHFAVAGRGECESFLKERVAFGDLPVTMLGWRSDIERILAATDILILTSDNEGIPLSLVQAALAGVPAIATNVGSVAEIVLHQETGLLTEPNAKDLAAALSTLLETEDLIKTLGQMARTKVSMDFGRTAFIGNHQDIYLETSAVPSA